MRDMPRIAMKALRLLQSPLWRRALLRGVAATIEHDEVPLRRDYQAILDVGANKGQFALYARHRWPDAEVHCFEPLAGPRAALEALFRDDQHVRVHADAVGAASGEAQIHVSRRDDSSSLLRISQLQSSRFPGTEEERIEEVVVIALDEVFVTPALPRPVLLKLDVQGYELEVLRGAEHLLGSVDTILVECSFEEFYEGQPLFDEIYRHLCDRGYRIAEMADFRCRPGRRVAAGRLRLRGGTSRGRPGLYQVMGHEGVLLFRLSHHDLYSRQAFQTVGLTSSSDRASIRQNEDRPCRGGAIQRGHEWASKKSTTGTAQPSEKRLSW